MTMFRLDIITPEHLAFSKDVDMVVAPSTSGTIGILPNHTPLFAQLTEGEVKIKKGKEEYFLSIGGGFIEVAVKKTTILVTRAVHAEKLNEKEILEAKKSAEEALKQKPTGATLETARTLLRSSLVDLKVLRHRRVPKFAPIAD